jgi:hypothetical protein
VIFLAGRFADFLKNFAFSLFKVKQLNSSLLLMLFQVAGSWGICALIGGCVADKKVDWNLGLFSVTNIHNFLLEEDSQLGKTEKNLVTLIFIQIK